MKHKPIKLDWEELEDSFNNLNDELVYYLDLVTGHVHLEGEGEEDEANDETYSPGAVSSMPPRSDGTRAYIQPPGTAIKIEWIQEFMKEEQDLDPDLVAKVKAGLKSDTPADDIRSALNQHPEDRDRWYLYRSDRIREHIERWLAEEKITPSDPPTWKKA